MKKLILLLLPILFLAVGCGESGDKPGEIDMAAIDTTSTFSPVPAEAPKDAKYKLQYKLEVGKTYLYKYTRLVSEEQKISADTVMAQKVTEKRNYIFKVVPQSIESDGTMELAFTVEDISIDADANGKKVVYKGGDEVDSSKKKQFVEFIALHKATFNVQLKPSGEIVEIFKSNKIADKMLEIGANGPIAENEKKEFYTAFIENYLKPLVMQVFKVFPEKELAKDSSWALNLPPMNFEIFTLNSTHNYKVNGFQKNQDDFLVVIDASLMSNAVPTPAAKQNKVDLKKTAYSGSGKQYFNTDKSVLQKSATTVSMALEFSLPLPNQRTGKMITVTQSQNSKTSNVTELLSIK